MLTPEYVAQYGGQQTQCHCGAAIQIPSAIDPFQTPPSAYPSVTNSPTQVLGYAGPATGQMNPGFGVWREGKQLVIIQGAELPDACVLCGGHTNGRRLTRSYSWHNPWIFIILLSPLIYIIVALIVRKSIKLSVPICEAHLKRRAWMIAVAWLTFVGGIVAGVVLGQDKRYVDIGFAVGLFGFVGALIIGLIGSRLMTPKFIDKRIAKFGGVSENYLSGLPSRY